MSSQASVEEPVTDNEVKAGCSSKKLRPPLLRGEFARYALLILGVCEVLFCSMITAGFNSLALVYQEMGVYSHLCKTSHFIRIIQSGRNRYPVCDEQHLYYRYAYIIWLLVAHLAVFPIGEIFDRFGQRVSKIISAFLFFVGCLLFACTSHEMPNLLFPAGCFIGLGYHFLLLPNMQISHLFPDTKNIVIAIMNGALDSSGTVFSVIRLAHDAGIPTKTSFSILGLSGSGLMVATSFLFMTYQQKDMDLFAPNGSATEGSCFPPSASAVEDKNDVDVKEDASPEKIIIWEEEMIANYPTFMDCLCSKYFIYNCVLQSFILVRYTYLLVGLVKLLEVQFGAGSDAMIRLNKSFDYFLLLGILVAPFCGVLIDTIRKFCNYPLYSTHFETRYWAQLKPLIIPFFICCISTTLMNCLILIPSVGAFFFAFFLFNVSRGFLFCLLISGFFLAFPLKYFGKAVCVANLISGIINLVQYTFLNVHSGNIFMLNVLLILLPLISFSHPINIYVSVLNILHRGNENVSEKSKLTSKSS